MVTLNAKWIRWLPLLMLVAVVGLRVLLVIPAYRAPHQFADVDSLQYIDLARGMWLTGQYGGGADDAIDLLRPPGYPVFLVLGLIMGNGSLSWVAVLQLLLVFATAWILYRVGLDIGSRRVGLAAAFLYLVNPNAAFWSLMLLTETLAAFLLALSVAGVVRYWKTGWRGWLLLSGLGLSAGAITRPIVLPLALMITLLLIWVQWRRQPSLKAAIPILAVMALGVFSLVLPWQVRNAFVHGRLTLSQVGETTFANWMVAKTIARVEGITRDEAAAAIGAAANPMLFSLEYVARHPTAFFREQARGVARTLLGADYVSWAFFLGRESIANASMLSALIDHSDLRGFGSSFVGQLHSPWFLAGLCALVFDFVLYGLCAAGLVRAVRENRHSTVSSLGALLALSLVYLLIVPMGAGDSRFRAPADPLLGWLAGLAFYDGSGGR